MLSLSRCQPLPLPPLEAAAAGPTPWSNIVIPGRLIAGAYPGSLDDAENDRVLRALLELGVCTFVCLQAEASVNTQEELWRSGMGLRPYIKDAQRLLSEQHAARNPRMRQTKLDYLHLAILDGCVATDAAISSLADDCIKRVRAGQVLYVHCWGGHGRTGTLIAIMLGRLYGLPYASALRHTQLLHDARKEPLGVRSPQTPVQREQVRRLLGLEKHLVYGGRRLTAKALPAAVPGAAKAETAAAAAAAAAYAAARRPPPPKSNAPLQGAAAAAAGAAGTGRGAAAPPKSNAPLQADSAAAASGTGRGAAAAAVLAWAVPPPATAGAAAAAAAGTHGAAAAAGTKPAPQLARAGAQAATTTATAAAAGTRAGPAPQPARSGAPKQHPTTTGAGAPDAARPVKSKGNGGGLAASARDACRDQQTLAV
ncbi:hypothetical protein FOA52_002872 [Chlamydomonas sp. UWO 241]|nr:hypothetical protein FOA52_002872 [Chlamydomonas sp. UWO 241]